MASFKRARICGKHSGIPKCCIKFWIGRWQKVIRPKTPGTYNFAKHQDYLDKIDKANESLCRNSGSNIGVRINYIPCPRCLYRLSFVMIRICDCSKESC